MADAATVLAELRVEMESRFEHLKKGSEGRCDEAAWVLEWLDEKAGESDAV